MIAFFLMIEKKLQVRREVRDAKRVDVWRSSPDLVPVDGEDRPWEEEKGDTWSSSDEEAVEAKASDMSPTKEQGEIGPMPLTLTSKLKGGYGGDLLPGEGVAMATFVQSGQRIPRRGEIGLTTDEISAYERAGYVMSGNRNVMMNAVRERKENQVISTEERRTMLLKQKEERIAKESKVLADLKSIVDAKVSKFSY